MLKKATFTFLKGLEKNNNKEWFDEHRDAYGDARLDFEAFVSNLMVEMTAIEPGLGNQKAKDTIFRIFRDVRFSKDKTPYKPHMSAYLSREGRKWEGAGYYIHAQPGKSFLAAGLWMPEAKLLKSLRQEIDYDLEGFEKILGEKSFKKHFAGIEGEALQKVPQGYSADNPAATYLKLKSFVVTHKIGDEYLTEKGGIKKIAAAFAAAKPFVDFFNRALD